MTDFVFDKEKGTLVSSTAPDVVEDTATVSSSGSSIVNETHKANVNDPEEAEVVFKKFSDLSIVRVDDKATGQWLCYFSGYALDIQFNIEELRKGDATKKIEACLEGLRKMFKGIIMDQALNVK